MGLLDQVLAQAAQNQQTSSGQNLMKPLVAALGALLVGKMMGEGGQAQAGVPFPQQTPASSAPAGGIPDGGLVGGLGGLLQKLNQAGHGEVVKSWTSPGPNQPISPGHLGAAIGPQNVQVAAQQAGLNEQELLQHLAQNLPQIVSALTQNGAAMPSLAQIAAALTQGQQR
jgi:uncharacterized protein YidB (DUF937 family)